SRGSFGQRFQPAEDHHPLAHERADPRLSHGHRGRSALRIRPGRNGVRSDAGRSLRHQWAYVEPRLADFLPGPFRSAADIVSYFGSLVGPFPYEKLAHLESSTRFGGMENATAIFYADQPFRKRTMADGVVAHETAHQWL